MPRPHDRKDSEATGERKRPKLKREKLKDLAAREPDAERMKGGRQCPTGTDCSAAVSGCSL